MTPGIRDLVRLLAPFRPHLGPILVAAALLVVAGVLPGAAVLLVEDVVDRALIAGDRAALIGAVATLVVLAAAHAALVLLRTWITRTVSWSVAHDLRTRLHARYLALGADPDASSGDRLVALLEEVDEVRHGVSALAGLVRNPVQIAVLVGAAVSLAPALAAWTVPMGLLVGLVTRWTGGRVRRRAEQARRARQALGDLAHDQLVGLPEIQARAAEEAEARRFRALSLADAAARQQLDLARALPRAAVLAVAAAGAAGLLGIGGGEVLAGRLEPGELIAFTAALGLLGRPLSDLAEVWSLLQRSRAALARVHATLDPPPGPAPGSEPVPEGPLTLRWRGATLCRGGRTVLRDVDLTLRPGERVALVGPSGSGKSTLLASAVGLVPLADGDVEVGGVSIGRLDPAALRRAVALVHQQPFVAHRSIAENLTLGAEGASGDAVARALRSAGCDGFVAGLPAGVDTPVAELGRSLSGGERQRLCLARALLGAPRVLLLDESTSEVDGPAQRALLETLDDLGGEVAVLWATHDPERVRAADRVVVVGEGRVAGTRALPSVC